MSEKCPHCKTGMVAPDTDELNHTDLKCKMCGRTFVRINGLLVLSSLDGDAVIKSPSVKTEVATKVPAIPVAEEKKQEAIDPEKTAVKETAQKSKPRAKVGHKAPRLDDKQKQTILDRLAKGDHPRDIALDIPCDITTVYNYKRAYEDEKKKLAAGDGSGAKRESAKDKCAYGGHKARAVQCMMRVREGKVPPDKALKMMEHYRPFLVSDINKLTRELNAKKKELKHIDEAISGVTILNNGWEELRKKI